MNKNELYKKIKLGLEPIQGKTILHTAPHHDDILLGYFPYAVRNLLGNTNYVLYITSGSNGISDTYLAEHLSMTKQDVQLLDHAYKQELKFAIRESESEQKWLLCAGDSIAIKHLRASFYAIKEDGPTLEQAMERDIERVVDYLKIVQPDVITILVDPIGIGPATHHRSQQVMMQAIARLDRQDDITILGYRNVWSTFSLAQASMIVPVTQAELDQVKSIFLNCFVTQSTTIILDEETKNFAQQATQIQKYQWQSIVSLLDKQEQQGDQLEFDGAIFLQELKL